MTFSFVKLSSMDPAICAAAFACYSLLVFVLKRITYPQHLEPDRPFPVGWKVGHEFAIFVSPDFWWAKRFKSLIQQFKPKRAKTAELKAYVKNNNRWNFWLSAMLTLTVFVAFTVEPKSKLCDFLLAMAVIRMVSRSFEVAYAFGQDVLQESQNSTGLTKFERVKLALVSYAEMFVYSAAAYIALPCAESPIQALTLSLNVGTLTNVGLAFAGEHPDFYNNLVFVQVFTSLSLVVLSLASYLSRRK